MRLHFINELFSAELSKAIGWTLIHSLWQGLLAAVLAGVIIIMTKKSAAKHRYNLLAIVLILFLIATGVTFSIQINGAGEQAKKNHEQSLNITGSVIVGNYTTEAPASKTTLNRFVSFFNSNAEFVVLTWAVIFLFHCIKLMTGIAGVQRIRNYRTYPSPEQWQVKMGELCNMLGLKKTINLLQSGIVKVPVAVGHFKPVILIPLGLLSNLPAEQVETILLHELAHIKRKDYFVNILQRMAEAVFFFNPALLWVSSLLRQEREACCDDIVVSHTAYKGNYLEALVSFHEYSAGTSQYAMAIKSKQSFLLNRVKRMITRENKKLDSMEKIALIAGLVVITAFSFIPKNESVVNQKPLSDGRIEEPAVVAATASREPVVITHKHLQRAGTPKQNKKPRIEIPAIAYPADTVPSAKKSGDTENNELKDLKIQSFSSNVNDDGNTKKETTTIVTGSGKTYNYTRLNGNITSLTVDGKSIPENEFSNYDQLIGQIEKAREENKVRRLANLNQRRLAVVKQREDLRTRIADQNLQRKFQTLQRQLLVEQKKQLLDLNKSGRTLENKRKEVFRLMERLKERRQGVPMLNGREIIKNDKQTDYKNSPEVSIDVIYKAEIMKQKTVELKKASINSLEKDVQVRNQPPKKALAPINTVNPQLLKKFDYTVVTGKSGALPNSSNEKSIEPEKYFPVKKIPVISNPLKPPAGLRSVKRRATT